MKANSKSIGLMVSALAVAVSPVVASAATSSQTNTVTAVMAEVISVTASNPGNISITPSTAGPTLTSVTHNVSVTTNVANGYNLTLASSDGANSMTGAGTASGHSITASANTSAAPAALATNTWGYAVPGAPFGASYTAENSAQSSGTLWAGVPINSSPVNIRSTTGVASGQTTAVWYAVEVDYSKPNGTYTESVTYTGTTK